MEQTGGKDAAIEFPVIEMADPFAVLKIDKFPATRTERFQRGQDDGLYLIGTHVNGMWISVTGERIGEAADFVIGQASLFDKDAAHHGRVTLLMGLGIRLKVAALVQP